MRSHGLRLKILIFQFCRFSQIITLKSTMNTSSRKWYQRNGTKEMHRYLLNQDPSNIPRARRVIDYGDASSRYRRPSIIPAYLGQTRQIESPCYDHSPVDRSMIILQPAGIARPDTKVDRLLVFARLIYRKENAQIQMHQLRRNWSPGAEIHFS